MCLCHSAIFCFWQMILLQKACQLNRPGALRQLERRVGDAVAIPKKTWIQSRTPMVDGPTSAALHGAALR